MDDGIFSTINTEEKAYWLGYIMADGCVKKHSGKRSRNSYILRLTMASNDVTHLRKFKSFLGAEQKITHTRTWDTLDLCNLKLCNDLATLGVLPNKSGYEDTPKLSNASLYQHFYRGYFDGDGCIYRGEKTDFRKRDWTVVLFGGRSLLENFSLFVGMKGSLKSKGGTWRLDLRGLNQSYKALFPLYHNSTIYLQRKFDKYLATKNDFLEVYGEQILSE